MKRTAVIIGVAAAMGVFAPVAAGSPERAGGLPVIKKKPAVVKPALVLRTRIEGSRTLYRFGDSGLWME
jgi:hypothetical protein